VRRAVARLSSDGKGGTAGGEVPDQHGNDATIARLILEKRPKTMLRPQIEDRVNRLPESPEVWAVVNRSAPVWVEDDDEGPQRPTVMAVLEVSSGAARYVTVGERQSVTSAELLGFLYDAMLLTPHTDADEIEAPGMEFEPCRPARVVIEGLALANSLVAQLQRVGVACEGMERIDGIDEFLRHMDSHFNPDDVGGLARVPGMSVFNMQEYYAAAAAFYARAPWKWMVNLHVIEFHYSADPKPALVAIMGNGRQEFGLTTYADIREVEQMLAASKSSPADRHFRNRHMSSVTFTAPYEGHSFEDLDDVTRFNLPIANPNAYPLLLNIVPPGARVAPDFEEIMRYAALMRVLPDFVDTHLDAQGKLPRPAQATFALPEIYAGHTVTLRFPAYKGAPIRTPELEALGLVDEDNFVAWLPAELNKRTPFKCSLLPETADTLRFAGLRIRAGQKVTCQNVVNPNDMIAEGAGTSLARSFEGAASIAGEDYPGLLAAVTVGSRQVLIPLVALDFNQPDLPCGPEIAAYRMLFESADAEMMDRDSEDADEYGDVIDLDSLLPDRVPPEFLKMAMDALMGSLAAPSPLPKSKAKAKAPATKKPKPKKT
jgi:hypothetical protein